MKTIIISYLLVLNFGCFAQKNMEFELVKGVFLNTEDSKVLGRDTLNIINTRVLANRYEQENREIAIIDNLATIEGQTPSRGAIIIEGNIHIIYNLLHVANDKLRQSNNGLIKVSVIVNPKLVYTLTFYDQKLKYISQYIKGIKHWTETLFVGGLSHQFENSDVWIRDVEYICRTQLKQSSSGLYLRTESEVIESVLR